jgi:hypothetical protein
MSDQIPQNVTPSGKKLLVSTLAAMTAACVLLVLIVLPAEYGVDPTGVGKALGLTQLSAPPVRNLEIRDVIGGNEVLKTISLPDAGEPTPLPNPAVYQDEQAPPETRTLQVNIPADGQTEVKLKMTEGKVIVFSWAVDRGDIYEDYHGHDPALGAGFVRYEEQQEGSSNNGSLTAPFSGEHGWYWLNYNEFPVTITLTVTGYFDDLIDYGLF